MKTLEEALKSFSRINFTQDQVERSSFVQNQAETLLVFMWDTAQPSAELTMATRKLEEAVMWHSKAIANESK